MYLLCLFQACKHSVICSVLFNKKVYLICVQLKYRKKRHDPYLREFRIFLFFLISLNHVGPETLLFFQILHDVLILIHKLPDSLTQIGSDKFVLNWQDVHYKSHPLWKFSLSLCRYLKLPFWIYFCMWLHNIVLIKFKTFYGKKNPRRLRKRKI